MKRLKALLQSEAGRTLPLLAAAGLALALANSPLESVLATFLDIKIGSTIGRIDIAKFLQRLFLLSPRGMKHNLGFLVPWSANCPFMAAHRLHRKH